MTGQYLLVGLGNPGREYKNNRHNFGFMVLDQLAEASGWSFGRVQHQALVVSGRMCGKPVLLAKPQTFMNASGRSVASLMRFYRIDLERLLVVYDDLDLELGTLRFRKSGGSGGQKGVQSIIEQLGTDEFARLRLGIGRPPGRMDPADYVLRPFRASEEPIQDEVLKRSGEAVTCFMTEGIEMAMSRHNGSVLDEHLGSAAPATSG